MTPAKHNIGQTRLGSVILSDPRYGITSRRMAMLMMHDQSSMTGAGCSMGNGRC